MVETRQSLSREEVQTLLNAAQKQSLRCWFTVLLITHTGLRSREAARFSPDWFDPTTETITVPESKSSARTIPLHPQVSHQIAHDIRNLDETAFDVSPTTIKNRVRVAGEDAGLGWISAHTLRTSLIKRFDERGAFNGETDRIVTGPNTELFFELEAPDVGSSTDDSDVACTGDVSGDEWELEAENEMDAVINRYLAAHEDDLTEDVLTVHEVYLTHFRDWCVEASSDSSSVEFPVELDTVLERYVSERVNGSSAPNVNDRQQVLQQFRRWVLR